MENYDIMQEIKLFCNNELNKIRESKTVPKNVGESKVEEVNLEQTETEEQNAILVVKKNIVTAKSEMQDNEIVEVFDTSNKSDDYEEKNNDYNNSKIYELLESYDFKIEGKFLYSITQKGRKKISNFLPYLTKKTIYANGIDNEVRYFIKGIMLDNYLELPEIEISKEDLNNFNFIIGSSWEKYAVVIGNNKSKLREVCQILSRDTINETTIYTNTGFERIDGNLVYLYHNGAISKENIDVKADLSEGGLQQYCFTDKEFNIKEALQTSFNILKLAKEKVSIPLLAYIYITPLISLLREKNIYCDFLLMLIGGTNTGKSSLAAIANSHFGDFKRNTFNTSLNDTISKIEKQSYMLKDCMFVPDDLNPEHNGKKIELASKIIGSLADRQARGRVTSNIKIRKSYYARGTAILTGEFVPPLAKSRLSRTIILDFDKTTVNVDNLLIMQEHTKKLSYAMKMYIKFIIDNEDEILEECTEVIKKLQKLQKLQSSKYTNILGRTKEARNILYLGFHLFLAFMLENDIIDEKQKEKLEEKAEKVLDEIMLSQARAIEETNPTEMFYNALEALINSNKVMLEDYSTGFPIRGAGIKIGYFDSKVNRLYLYIDIIYNEVFTFYKKRNIVFPLTEPTLLKTLQEEGILETRDSDPSRKEILRTNPKTKEKERVINIRRHLEKYDD